MSAEFYLMVFLGFVMLGCFYYVMSDLVKICKMLKDLTKSRCETKSLNMNASFADGTTYEVKE
jgi:hypothetical protein